MRLCLGNPYPTTRKGDLSGSFSHFLGILPLPFYFTVSLSKGENKRYFHVVLEWHLFFYLYRNTILPGLICRTSSDSKVYPDIICTPNNKFLILSFYVCAGPAFTLFVIQPAIKIIINHFCEHKSIENICKGPRTLRSNSHAKAFHHR